MNYWQIWGSVICLLVVSGCAVHPTNNERENAEYGFYPDTYKEDIKNHFSNLVPENRDSRFTFLSPRKAWTSPSLSQQIKYGWAVCGRIEVKNRQDLFVTKTRFFVLLKSYNIIASKKGRSAAKRCEAIYKS